MMQAYKLYIILSLSSLCVVRRHYSAFLHAPFLTSLKAYSALL